MRGNNTFGSNIVTDGLVLLVDAGNVKSFRGEPTVNLAPYVDYSNFTYNYEYTAASWGGDAATVYYYNSGGYNNMPYKKMIKTSGGTGGSFADGNQYFTIENNKTYSISCWMKANHEQSVDSNLYLCINRSSDNTYRYNPSIYLTTEWVRYSWTYVSGADHSGTTYISRHIVYDNDNLPLEVYWCGFQVEEKSYVTPFVNGTRGTTVATGGGLLDQSGNNNNGELVNGPTYSSSNMGSLVFDGTNDYISDYSVPDSILNSGSWAISTWCKFSGVSKAYDNAIIGAGYAGGNAGLHLSERSSFVYFGFYGNDLPGTIPLSINTWYNIVFVFNYISKLKQIYVNGGFDNSNGTIGYSGTGSNLEIGRYPWSTGHLFYGNISNVSIYNRALTAAEILQNYNATKTRYGL